MVTKQYQEQPIQPPSFDVFGYSVTLPPQSTPILLALIFLSQALLVLKSKPVGFAIDLLRGSDLLLLERLDDIAIELRELTKADRVIIAGFHNGKQNTAYHWKRVSTLAEATRLGIEPVLSKTKDLDVISVFSVSDYEFLKKLEAHKTFVHTNQDLPNVSIKQKRFLLHCYMFGQYVMLLQDETVKDPYGVIFIQYDSREKCELDAKGTTSWSDYTRNSAHQKVMLVNSLIYNRGTSVFTKMLDWAKQKLRL